MQITKDVARTIVVDLVDWEAAKMGEVLSVKFIVYLNPNEPEEFDVILTVVGMRDDGDVENGPDPYPAPFDILVTDLAVRTIQYAPGCDEVALRDAKLIVEEWRGEEENKLNRARQQRAEAREFEAHMGRG